MFFNQSPIRDVLRELNTSAAHRAHEKPNISDIYTPPLHSGALDPNRPLVIGDRGTGKSFWASVLADSASRAVAAKAYPALNLDKVDVQLGFHEGAGYVPGIAPSRESLRAALDFGADATSIWRSVLLKALSPAAGPSKLKDRLAWIKGDPEEFEQALIAADTEGFRSNKTLLLVFDALDVLATDWQTIRELTRGLIRLSQEVGSTHSIRMKIFMRKDQYEDTRRKSFPDFSKLATSAVALKWRPIDLYGVLFSRLWNNSTSKTVFASLCSKVGIKMGGDDFPRVLTSNETIQYNLFSSFAGEFMGKNEKRGKTYTWIPKHLADAHGETSLRSFLLALREAANLADEQQDYAIDSRGISAGVLKASDTRRGELNEDHPWIDSVLKSLEGLTVPCEEIDIIERWKESNVVSDVLSEKGTQRPSAPIQLDPLEPHNKEQELLRAMIDLGIIEKRANNKINVPDIFRVAAKMKRKGGVPPRKHT